MTTAKTIDYFDPRTPGFYERPGMLTPAQIARILKPVAADRIETKQRLSYVPQQEIRAELTRTFGAGNWDSQVESQELLYEFQQAGSGDNASKMYWIIAYKVSIRLNIRDYWGRPVASFVEYHVEENAPQPNRGEAHVLALTSAASYALRRAAIGIGDNMGLHLYNKGSHEALIKGTLQQRGDANSPFALAQTEPKNPTPAATPQSNGAVMGDGDAPVADPAAAAGAQSTLASGFAHPDARA
jgi:hypothetical protein